MAARLVGQKASSKSSTTGRIGSQPLISRTRRTSPDLATTIQRRLSESFGSVHESTTRRPHVVRVRHVVALEHADPELPHALRVVDDLCTSDDRNALQLFVVVARFDHAGDPGVAADVDDLLRFGFGLDGERALEESVP